MNVRRALGAGPQDPAPIRAAQADLLDALPAVDFPDLDELRGRGVLGGRRTTTPGTRRTLGAGTRLDEE